MKGTDTSSYTGTPTHPHVAAFAMDPASWARFQRAFEDRPEVVQLEVDRTRSDRWIVYAACASLTVADLLESNW